MPRVGGAAVFFRRHGAAAASMAAGLRGLSAGACYSVQLWDEHYALALNATMAAAALREHAVALPAPATSALLEYRAVRGGC